MDNEATLALNRLKAAVDAVRLARTSGDEVLELEAMKELDDAWDQLKVLRNDRPQ